VSVAIAGWQCRRRFTVNAAPAADMMQTHESATGYKAVGIEDQSPLSTFALAPELQRFVRYRKGNLFGNKIHIAGHPYNVTLA